MADIIRTHYVLASSCEAAHRLADRIEAKTMLPMASTPQELLALLAVHPLGYPCGGAPLHAYAAYKGLAVERTRRLD